MHAASGDTPAQTGARDEPGIDSSSPERCYQIGRAYKARGELYGAEMAYRQALRLRPEFVDAWISLGILLRGANRPVEAEACHREALQLAPNHFLALLNLGNALLQQNRFEEAVASFRAALRQNPQSSEAHLNLAKTLQHRNDPEQGQHFYEALRLNPRNFEAAEHLGKCLFDAGQFDMAIGVFQHARELRPDAVGVQLDLAGTFAAARRLDQAQAEYRRLLQQHPDLPEALAGLAVVCATLGRTNEARELFEHALARAPSSEQVRFHYAPFLLRNHEFARGWPFYEQRSMSGNNEEIVRQISAARWRGEPLAGKRLLITCEQGLGDEIMFASLYAEMLRESAGCIIECDRRLHALLHRSFPQATLFPVDRKAPHWYRAIQQNLRSLPAFDYWIPAGSLPGFRRTDDTSFPSHRGYLACDPAKVAVFRQRLALLGSGLKVGISWRGGSVGTWMAARSLALEQLRPLLATGGVQFVSLQYGECRAEIDQFVAASGIPIHHWQDAIDDYDQTAALVGALDLVVSVCTAVVHLCGALGRPVWVMAPFVPEWRYGLQGPSMIWYPSVRMFRQPQLDQWQPVLQQVERALREWADTSELARALARVSPPGVGPSPSPGAEARTLGEAALLDKNYKEAVMHLRRAVALEPDSARGRQLLGKAMLHFGDPDGERQLIEALRLDPNDFEAHANLGRYLFQLGSFERALPLLRRACDVKPDAPDVRLELADAYMSTRRFADAVREFERVRRENPDRPVALAGLAAIHADHGRFEEACALFDEALDRQPDNAWIGFNYAYLLLRRGDFERGWKLYELRRQGFLNRDVFTRGLPAPVWQGEPLAGKRLIITAEQGLGDEMMFASLYREITAEADHCLIECDSRIEGLLRRSFPQATVFGVDRHARDWHRALEQRVPALPRFDYWIPAGTLPFYRRRTADLFPKHAGYLKADSARIERWRVRLRALGPGLKIGISWRGGTVLTNATLRSLQLPQLQPPLSTPGVQFVSLQYGDCRAELDGFSAMTGCRIHHWQDAVDDYEETAALVCALDLVITVCTAVVHLSGALGRPVWVLAPFVPEWRYGEHGPSMIWYPSVRMFRQPQPEDWAPVFSQVQLELRDLLARRGEPA